MREEQGFIAVHETVHLVKFIGYSIFFFRGLMLRYLVLQDTIKSKVFVPDSYGLPGRTTTELTFTISGLC